MSATQPKPQWLGPYRLDRKVGARSMRVEYEGVGPRAGAEPGAVRLTSMTLGDEVPDAILERFVREAERVSAIRHRNILRTVGHGFEQGTAFVAVEPYDGERLSDLIAATGPLDPQAVAIAGLDLASALLEVHALEPPLLHRAIAPEEIVVDAEGHVRLGGFAASSFVVAMGGVHSRLLQLSAGYQSPESVKSNAVGPSSDLFALGATLYEALSGQAAFAGTTPLQTTLKVSMASFTPLPKLVMDADEGLVALIHGLLAKDPAARPDARATRDALWEWLGRSDAPRRQWAARLRPPAPQEARPARPRTDTDTAEHSVDDLGAGSPQGDEPPTEMHTLPEAMLPTPTVRQELPEFSSYSDADEAPTVIDAGLDTEQVALPPERTELLPETVEALRRGAPDLWTTPTALEPKPRPAAGGAPAEIPLAIKVLVGAVAAVALLVGTILLTVWIAS